MSEPTPEPTPDLDAAGRQLVAAYGQRAGEVVEALLAACRANDGVGGGQLCAELWNSDPGLMVLVISTLTTRVVKRDDGLSPEDVGIDVAELGQSMPWQTAINDQIEAAMVLAQESGDVTEAASLIVEAQKHALSIDFRQHMADHGHYPDVGCVIRGMLLLNHSALTVVAAEAVRQLTVLEVSDGA